MAWLRYGVAASALLFLPWSALSCGTDAMGTDACRKIEQARCRKAPACPLLGLSADGVEECVQFARDRCLHGLPVADPGPPVVDACVAVIEQSTDCAIVASPESAPACAFLKPLPSGEDASSDASSETPSDTAVDDADADAPNGQ